MKARRGTLFVEQGEVLSRRALAGAQHVLRLRSPRIARAARPGTFVHLQCSSHIAMRRPMSIMRVEHEAGWLELLYKRVGVGTRALAEQPVGASLSLIGPIGEPFSAPAANALPLLVGGGVGIPPIVFLADRLRERGEGARAFAIMGSEVPFPFEVARDDAPIPGIPTEVWGCSAELREGGIASRLASRQGYPGCFPGFVTELASAWLEGLAAEARTRVRVYACGPNAMLRAVAALGREWGLACEVALEEYMACGVGGCAGCAVAVRTDAGLAMKRVCVDGPVFDAERVLF